jgi:hypothetical protein
MRGRWNQGKQWDFVDDRVKAAVDGVTAPPPSK